MLKRITQYTSGFVLLMVSGCAFVNVSLTPPTAPMDEQVIEGKGRPKILLMDIAGFISEQGRSGRLGLQDKPSLVAQFKEEIQKAEQDRDIAGIIVKINSPGGTVSASDIIYHEIVKFKQNRKVPVYAVILGIGTSGGYYVAAGADTIYAHPTALTGNIGVLVMKFNIEGLLGKIGVEEETFKSGDKKDILSLFRRDTPEEKEIIMSVIKSMNDRFIDAVANGRKGVLSRAEVERLADGRICTADQAVKAKLIDGVGYLDDAIANMIKSLGVEEARVVTYVHPGEYKPTIYSTYQGERSSAFDMLRNDAGMMSPLPGWEFLYLWDSAIPSGETMGR
ncbi:MAG: signal peptide peptidase SppA [bacterium]